MIRLPLQRYYSDLSARIRRVKNIWKVRRERHIFSMLGLIKQGQVDKAEEVFERLLERKIRPNTVAYNALLSGYAILPKPDVRKAFHYFNHLKKRGLLPCDRTYSSMFSICAKVGPSANKILSKLQDEMDRRDVILNPIAMNSLLNALIHCGRAYEVFDKYVEQSEVTIETFSTLLMACAKTDLGKLKEIWNNIYESQLTPELHCFNTLLVCLRDGQIPDHMSKESNHIIDIPNVQRSIKAENELNLCLKGGIDLTLYVCGSLRWVEKKDVDSLLKCLNQAKVKPDIRFYTLLMSLVADIYYLLKSDQVGLDDVFIMAAFNRLRSLGDSVGAEELLHTSYDLGYIQDSYYLLKAKCCYTTESTDDFLEKLLRESKVSHKLKVFEQLIKNALNRRDYFCIVNILKKMRIAEILPSSSMVKMLDETAASDPPNKLWQVHRFNGFKGYYKLWKTTYGIHTNEH